MEKQLLLAIDAGTTGIRTILYDRRGQEVARSYREFRQITPAPGLLEHDPMEIWEVTRGLMQETLQKARIEPADVAAIGVTGQRATTLVWDRATGQPLYNALVWQDLRTYRRCMELTQALGFTISPIASLTKVEWLLQNVPGAREKVAEGEALVGTLDTWLIWKLTGGKAFVTDPSNACTTLLWDPGTGGWNPQLAGLAGVPVEALAKVSPSSGVYGETASAVFGAPVPVAAVAGDAGKAMEIQRRLLPVHRQLFVEANPIPVKWAMARMGLCGGALRLPMTPLATANEPVVEGALRASGLLA